MVRDAIIVETENCTIRIRNLTFSGRPDVIHQDEYLVPIYSKPLQNTSYSKNDEENFMLRILNLEELNEIQISLNHTQKRVTFGGVILLALTILCFFTAYFYRKIQGNSKEKHTKLPELLTTKHLGEVDMTAKTTDETSKNGSKGGHTMTSLSEVLKHQTRTFDTYGGRRYEKTDHANM